MQKKDPGKPMWMMFMRETDGLHFVWNGEHPICISPVNPTGSLTTRGALQPGNDQWHHGYGETPDEEREILDTAMYSVGKRTFSIPDHGRYQVVVRQAFREV